MNNNDRKNIKEVLDHLSEARIVVAKLLTSEHTKLDNMPEAFQCSERSDKFIQAIDELELAMMGLKICETHLRALCPIPFRITSKDIKESKFPKVKWEKFMMKSLEQN